MSTPFDQTSPSDKPQVYIPGNIIPKLLYLIAGLAVFTFGFLFLWEPLGRLLLGQTIKARVAEIRVIEPGQPDVVYNYRRDYEPERNLAITFQHYVSIPINGQPVLYRISVDSRKAPIPTLNCNDIVKVAYYPNDEQRLAFDYANERTWGAGGLFAGIGLLMLMTAIPMLIAARRPIIIDPE